jgi:hypothetical protein
VEPSSRGAPARYSQTLDAEGIDEVPQHAFAQDGPHSGDHRPHVAAAVAAQVHDPAHQVVAVSVLDRLLDAVRERDRRAAVAPEAAPTRT